MSPLSFAERIARGNRGRATGGFGKFRGMSAC